MVDIICYRRFGHNEADQPAFTQPLMYKKIGAQDPVDKIYNTQLIEQGVIDDVRPCTSMSHDGCLTD